MTNLKSSVTTAAASLLAFAGLAAATPQGMHDYRALAISGGERDVECPPAQSTEFWHWLKAMGTPTSLVIYDGERHSLRMPENQRDQRARTLVWFDRYLR